MRSTDDLVEDYLSKANPSFPPKPSQDGPDDSGEEPSAKPGESMAGGDDDGEQGQGKGQITKLPPPSVHESAANLHAALSKISHLGEKGFRSLHPDTQKELLDAGMIDASGYLTAQGHQEVAQYFAAHAANPKLGPEAQQHASMRNQAHSEAASQGEGAHEHWKMKQAEMKNGNGGPPQPGMAPPQPGMPPKPPMAGPGQPPGAPPMAGKPPMLPQAGGPPQGAPGAVPPPHGAPGGAQLQAATAQGTKLAPPTGSPAPGAKTVPPAGHGAPVSASAPNQSPENAPPNEGAPTAHGMVGKPPMAPAKPAHAMAPPHEPQAPHPAMPAQPMPPAGQPGVPPPKPGMPPMPPKSPMAKSMAGLDELGDYLEKAMGGERSGHKYIKREGSPGSYKYTYRPGHSYTAEAFHAQTEGASAKQHRAWGDEARGGGDPYLSAAHRNMASYLDTGAPRFKEEIPHNLGQHYHVTREKPGDHVHHVGEVAAKVAELKARPKNPDAHKLTEHFKALRSGGAHTIKVGQLASDTGMNVDRTKAAIAHLGYEIEPHPEHPHGQVTFEHKHTDQEIYGGDKGGGKEPPNEKPASSFLDEARQIHKQFLRHPDKEVRADKALAISHKASDLETRAMNATPGGTSAPFGLLPDAIAHKIEEHPDWKMASTLRDIADGLKHGGTPEHNPGQGAQHHLAAPKANEYSGHPDVQKYIRAMKSPQKKSYAQAYAKWKDGGEQGAEPEHKPLSYMAAQAVRLHMGDVVTPRQKMEGISGFRTPVSEAKAKDAGGKPAEKFPHQWTQKDAEHMRDQANQKLKDMGPERYRSSKDWQNAANAHGTLRSAHARLAEIHPDGQQRIEHAKHGHNADVMARHAASVYAKMESGEVKPETPKAGEGSPDIKRLPHETAYSHAWTKDQAESTRDDANKDIADLGLRNNLSTDEKERLARQHFRASAAHKRIGDLSQGMTEKGAHAQMTNFHHKAGNRIMDEVDAAHKLEAKAAQPKKEPKPAKPVQGDLFAKKSMSGLTGLGDYLRKSAEQIPGGLASGKSPKDFDGKALAAGIKVEMEHTGKRAVAQEIAMDHLTEDPRYYTKLAKMEKSDKADEAIADLLQRDPHPDDTQVHALAGKLGMKVDDLEERIYAMAGKQLQKGEGEGSRGGHVIGHGSGGKPIYESNRQNAPGATTAQPPAAKPQPTHFDNYTQGKTPIGPGQVAVHKFTPRAPQTIANPSGQQKNEQATYRSAKAENHWTAAAFHMTHAAKAAKKYAFTAKAKASRQAEVDHHNAMANWHKKQAHYKHVNQFHGTEKSMTGLNQLGDYLEKSAVNAGDGMPAKGDWDDIDKPTEQTLGESANGGDLTETPTPEGNGGSAAGEGQDARGQLTGVGQGQEEILGDDRSPAQQMTPGTAALQDELPEGYKSLTPAAQREMVAKEHAMKVAQLQKSTDVTVGAAHPLSMQTIHGNTDAEAEALLKSDFYHGASPTLAQPGSVLRQSVLCKSEGCGCKYSAMLTACPACGSGTTVSRMLPRSAYLGGGDAVRLEKSAFDPLLRPAPVDADVSIPGASPVVFRRR